MATYDYEAQQGDINRRRKLMDAMMAMSLQGPQTPQSGNLVAGTNPMAALATVLQAHLANKGGKKLDAQQGELSKRYSDDLRQGMEQFYRTSEGQQYQSGVMLPQNGQLQTVTEAPNPRKAVLDAIGSNHPVLQQFGMSQLEAQQKAGLEPKDLLPYATPESIQEMISGGMLGFKPKQADLKEVGGILYDPSTRNVAQLGGRDPTVETVGADLYERNPSTDQLKKLDNAPQTTINNNMNAESAFQRAFGQAEGTRLSAAVAMRPQMQDAVNATEKGLELLQQGIHTGITGNIANNLQRVDAALFNSDPAKSARTQEFISYIGDVVIPGLKAFGGSDTVEEMKYLQAVSGGDITLEPQALSQILQSIDQKTRRKLNEVDGALEQVRAQGMTVPTVGLGVLAPTSEAPAEDKGTDSNPYSLEELLQLYPGLNLGQ